MASVESKHFWYFILAMVLVNALTIYVSAFIFKMHPGLKHHHQP